MNGHGGKGGGIPEKSAADIRTLSISGMIRRDGKITGYVLSNGLKITIEQREAMEQSGELA